MELQSKGRGEEVQALIKGQLGQHGNAKSGDSDDNEPERASQSSMATPRVVTGSVREDAKSDISCDDQPIVVGRICDDKPVVLARNGKVCPLYGLLTSEFTVQHDLWSMPLCFTGGIAGRIGPQLRECWDNSLRMGPGEKHPRCLGMRRRRTLWK